MKCIKNNIVYSVHISNADWFLVASAKVADKSCILFVLKSCNIKCIQDNISSDTEHL